MSNTFYPVTGSSVTVTPPNYSAFAIETVLKREWTNQVTSAIPLLACIKDRDMKFRKGFEISGTRALVPIIFEDISGFTTSTAGVADADEIPSAWPTYDATSGFSQAAYDFTHLRRAMTVRDSERVLTKNGARGNLLDGKTRQLMAKFKAIMADMIEGSANASRTALLGTAYAIATANVVGGIDQSTSSWWRGGLTTSVGTLSLPVINNAFDAILRHANDEGDTDPADLLLLSFNGTNTNTYGRMRELIAPAERFENAEFKAKYGIANFMYLGLKCVMSNRLAANSAQMLSTSTWGYGGYENPMPGEIIRIPGSDAKEHMYTLWAALVCFEIRRNWRFTGITG